MKTLALLTLLAFGSATRTSPFSAPSAKSANSAHSAHPAHSAYSAFWKINTHLFAANKALADALNDGMVSIPPFGDFPVAASALKALRAMPSAYRAGVLAPDLFPDMYVGGWWIHSDMSTTPGDQWTADHWMRHLWGRARAWSDASERDKVLAFAYGFLTHGAGDMWAHTYVNQKADGAWVTFTGPSKITALRHVVLEGYVGQHTPQTELALDVWPRFVSNVLIKDPAARAHSQGAVHYRKFLEIYDWLDPLIARARKTMNENISNDAPYWAKCTLHPIACAKKEQMETWRLDINRGLRALVDSSESLGELLMDGQTGAGGGAMTGWMVEWVPKMFGAHAIGEGAAAMNEFLSWVGGVAAPVSEAIKDETLRFFKRHFNEYYELYQTATNPSSYMDQLGLNKAQVNQDMGIPSGSGDFNWRAFEPIYNSVILSKLVLLDGTGLNQLAQRAGLGYQLFAPGEDTNIMLGTFRSMTQSYQWMGEIVDADTGSIKTTFGICGPETGAELKKKDWCGNPGGFVLWRNAEAREKIFRVIFKGYGPGPGSAPFADLDLGQVAGTRETARALRAAGDQLDYMVELVTAMQAKIPGVVAARTPLAPAPAPLPGRTPVPGTTAPAPTALEVVTDWGQRCCGKDLLELRAALARIQTASSRMLSSTAMLTLGRRTSGAQIAGQLTQLNAALDAFRNTRDATAAAAALAAIARQLDVLAGLVTGT
jgi:zinc dependent phospholipase C